MKRLGTEVRAPRIWDGSLADVIRRIKEKKA